jgi:hypothetical protein
VIGEHQFTLRVGPKRWYALNPEFARDCGLTCIGRDDFAWIDERGEIAARTIHWRDGPGRRQPPQFDEVFGEGWLVIMRRDALCRSLDPAVLQLDRYATRKAAVREDDGEGNGASFVHSLEFVRF